MTRVIGNASRPSDLELSGARERVRETSEAYNQALSKACRSNNDQAWDRSDRAQGDYFRARMELERLKSRQAR